MLHHLQAPRLETKSGDHCTPEPQTRQATYNLEIIIEEWSGMNTLGIGRILSLTHKHRISFKNRGSWGNLIVADIFVNCGSSNNPN